MKTKALDKFLSDFLEISKFNDSSLNGLQVEGNEYVKSIALGVSVSMSLFKKALEKKADTIIVHHGLFWGNSNETLRGVRGQRVGYLFRNNMNLFGYHLPLDHHERIGNNASIADELGLKNRCFFARHGGVDIGIIGMLSSPVPVEKIDKILNHFFGQISCRYFFGNKNIKTIAIVSGGASGDVYEAYAKGADLYITGETGEPIQEWCREARMNYIAGGHYCTEKEGVKKLGEIITKKFDIPCNFIEVANRI